MKLLTRNIVTAFGGMLLAAPVADWWRFVIDIDRNIGSAAESGKIQTRTLGWWDHLGRTGGHHWSRRMQDSHRNMRKMSEVNSKKILDISNIIKLYLLEKQVFSKIATISCLE